MTSPLPLNPPTVTLENGLAVFTLATGEKIRVSFSAERLTLEGYGLKIMTDRSKLLVVPSSNNGCEITTPQAMALEARLIDDMVLQRDAEKKQAQVKTVSHP